MISRTLHLACYLALLLNPAAIAALPIPLAAAPTPAAAPLEPVHLDRNAQRPFARPSPSARLRFVDDHDSSDTDAASPSSIYVTADTIFADSIPVGGGGVEASLAAVLASRQMQAYEKWSKGPKTTPVPVAEKPVKERREMEKQMLRKRDWVVPGQPTGVRTSSSAASTSLSTSTSSTITTAESSFVSLEPSTPISPTTSTSPTPSPSSTSSPLSPSSTSPAAPAEATKWFIATPSAPVWASRSASFGSLGDL
ncbi:hypothetical protein JCM8097_003238 [Rhodosporidiobolus ruineniae]